MKVQSLALTLILWALIGISTAIQNEETYDQSEIDPIRYSIDFANGEYAAHQISNIQPTSTNLLRKLRNFNIYRSFAPFAAHSRRRMHKRHRHHSHSSPHFRHRHRHHCNQEYSSTPKVTTENIFKESPVTQKSEKQFDRTTAAPQLTKTTRTTTSSTSTPNVSTTPRYNDPDNELIDPIDLRFGGD